MQSANCNSRYENEKIVHFSRTKKLVLLSNLYIFNRGRRRKQTYRQTVGTK